MESRSKAIRAARVKAAAAQFLFWGVLVTIAGAIIVAVACDSLLFRFYPAAGSVTASAIFVLALIFCCWAMFATAFEYRRFLLRVAINSVRRRPDQRQGQQAPAWQAPVGLIPVDPKQK